MNKQIAYILIVENEERFAILFERAFHEEGFITKTIYSTAGLEGIYRDMPEKPAIMIVDAFGFGKGKLETAKTLAREFPSASLVIISSLTSINDYMLSYSIGAKRFLHK